MSEEKICKYLLPCGYCDKFDKECATFKTLSKTLINSTGNYIPNYNVTTNMGDNFETSFTSKIIPVVQTCEYYEYSYGRGHCSGQKNKPECWCEGDESRCEIYR